MGKYALVIGCNNYEDEQLRGLTAPSTDVLRLSEILLSPLIGGFDDVVPLIDSQYNEVQLAIADLFADKTAGDLLLLYFSGHGLLDIQGRLFLATCNTKRKRLSVTGISSVFINEEMANSNSKKQIMILDCCYSGAFYKGSKGELGSQVLNQSTFESQGYAKVVITATNATQYAFEGDQVTGSAIGSLFTSFLLEGLETGDADSNEDGEISVDELYTYAYEQVTRISTNQTPKMWTYNQQGPELIIAKSDKQGARFNSTSLSPIEGIINDTKIFDFINQLPLCKLRLNSGASLHHNKTISDTSSHRIICGDNLFALKAIVPSFASKIKCIYVDPPYNTGLLKSFDSKSLTDMDSLRLGTIDYAQDEGLENKWIDMIYPRLILARELLSDDGIIFVSIDDKEIYRLGLLLDRVFGSINHLCTLIWKKKRPVLSDNRNGISVDHEYILCYSRSPDFRFRGQDRDFSKYSNPDDDQRGPWILTSLTGSSDEKARPSFHYVVINPATGIRYYPPKNRGWRITQEKMKQLIEEGRIFWPKERDGQIRMKRYLSETSKSVPLSTIIDEISLFGTSWSNAEEKRYAFDSPKPVDLLKLLISQIPDNDFWIADIFGGSATTGQATVELNHQDGGSRKFILIESDPTVAKKVALERMKKTISVLPDPHKPQVLYYSLTKPRK
jgi:DNA modification methylase